VNRVREAVMVLAFAACTRSADAQTVTGNVFAGDGFFSCCHADNSLWHIGAGGQIPVARAVSAGGDFGVLDSSGSFLLSFNGWYHFKVHDPRQPQIFLTGGLGVASERDSATGGANFGGGIDFWLADRRGVRIEIRDQLLGEYRTMHLVIARVGFIFR
jgi:hypothetical protein